MKSFCNTSFSVYPPDGTRCRGAYYPGDNGVVGIHVHGFRSSVEHTKARFFLDHALQRGYSWANFDLPCHGRSEGRFRKFRVSGALAALIEVIHQFRGAPVLLLGVSMGAWLSMLAARQLANAANVTIAGAVLIAPAFDFFQQYFQSQPAEALRQWQHDGARRFTDRYDDNRPYILEYAALEDGLRYSILERPAAWDFPVQIFHGDRDEVAPLRLSHRFNAISAGSDVTLRILKGGDHTLNRHLPLIAEGLDRMFEKIRAPERV